MRRLTGDILVMKIVQTPNKLSGAAIERHEVCLIVRYEATEGFSHIPAYLGVILTIHIPRCCFQMFPEPCSEDCIQRFQALGRYYCSKAGFGHPKSGSDTLAGRTR